MYRLRSGVAMRFSSPLPRCPADIRAAMALADERPHPGSRVAARTTLGW